MPSELEELFKQTVKKTNTEIQAAKKDVELEKLLKELELTDVQYKEFLKKRDEYKPSLFKVQKALDDFVVGEYTSRMSLFTAFILSNLNIYVSGPSASGKSAIMDAVTNLVMQTDIVLLEGGSEKVLIERERDIRKCKWLIARELNKIANSEIIIECLKSFAEGKPYQYKRSSVRGGYQSFELEPRAWCFSRADESNTKVPIEVELQSRLTEITVDSSQNQTLAVLSRQAENFINPFAVQQVDMVDRACLKWHISNLPNFDVYVSPAAQLLKNFIPSVFTTARRKFGQYNANANGICRFYYKDHITTTIQGKSTIFVTPQCYFYNHLIFGQNLIDASLQCSSLQKTIMKIIIENGSLSKQEIQQKLRTYSVNQTIKTIEGHLDHLSNLGYLNVTKEGNQNFYSASSFYKNFELKPNMKEVVECCKEIMLSIDLYKPYAQEYIQRFCSDEAMWVIEPFTGERVNMLEYVFKSAFDINNEHTRIQMVTEEEVPVSKNAGMSLSNFF